MEIYVLFIEYEIIELITTNKELWLEQLKRRAREDGGLHPGDHGEVWKDSKKLYDVYKLSDIR
ncbi:hypothetical protein DNH61_11730 [Paenibacillus sambharensis]|uniref:Uncharacterized protein n=1 Tax=Paenibacillus sambharensis TaxID=1803190 RepID=A0A2W1L8I8_9BACL|nr:hypothetical protein [Paenibacillus sambharensis]PZD95223.1 hypothetical protein DNH61_11730 [Paenibacillus sambharensis]